MTVQQSSVTIKAHTEDLHVSSTVYGPAARVGLDVMLHPDWSLKVEGAVRFPLNAASYTEDDSKAIPEAWMRRVDHFATIAANVGIAKTF